MRSFSQVHIPNYDALLQVARSGLPALRLPGELDHVVTAVWFKVEGSKRPGPLKIKIPGAAAFKGACVQTVQVTLHGVQADHVAMLVRLKHLYCIVLPAHDRTLNEAVAAEKQLKPGETPEGRA